MKYYTNEKITEHVTAIRSISGEIMYLIEGNEKAVLLDTCLGVGHLHEFVTALTEKPITVLLSHGHLDHAMGAPEFEEVYMNPADIPLYQSQCSLEARKGYIAGNIGDKIGEIKEDEYVIPTPDYPFQELKEGMVFDLGDIHIEVYGLPGHTKGTMIFLVREERILVLGDSCNNATFLFDENCSSVAEYKEQVNRIAKLLAGRYDRTFLMHRIVDASPEILQEMQEVCDQVLKGQSDEISFAFMGMKGLIAKKVNERLEREDGGFANLIYNPEKLW
jgi:glyoxylase-like metal-dependent hydrolase (beta-lactamase superfamily II)